MNRTYRPITLAAVLAVMGDPLPGAACRGHAPDHDAALDGETSAQREARWRRAIARCTTCPALPDCARRLDLLDRNDDGILAGRLVLGGHLVPADGLTARAALVRPAAQLPAQHRQETAMSTPMTLTEHVTIALHAQRDRILTQATERGMAQADHDELAEQLDARHAAILASATHDDPDQRLIYVEPWAVHSRPGRIDTRGTRAVVRIRTAAGDAVLCDPLLRELVDGAGQPIDARGDTRALLAQLQGAPDDPSTLHATPAPAHPGDAAGQQ